MAGFRNLFSFGISGVLIGASLTLIPVQGELIAPPTTCRTTMPVRVGSVDHHTIAGSNGCLIYVANAHRSGLIFRSYIFSQAGALQVFESYGPGEEAEQTGSRTYFFLPRIQVPTIQPVANNTDLLEITTAAQVRFRLDTRTARLTSLVDGDFLEFPEIIPQNEGGFEILSAPRLWIDTGYARGQAAYENLSRTSLVTDARGRSCTLTNSLLFQRRRNEVFLKNDLEIRQVLDQNCRHLSAGF